MPYDASLQEQSFRCHIEAARQLDLPVIIHTREADEATRCVVESEMKKAPFKGLIHCFSGDKDFALWAQDQGLYISFSGVLTYKKALSVQEAAKFVQKDRLLVETDSPFLSPQIVREQVCEPSFVSYTAQMLAEIRGESFEAIVPTDNTKFLYPVRYSKGLRNRKKDSFKDEQVFFLVGMAGFEPTTPTPPV